MSIVVNLLVAGFPFLIDLQVVCLSDVVLVFGGGTVVLFVIFAFC